MKKKMRNFLYIFEVVTVFFLFNSCVSTISKTKNLKTDSLKNTKIQNKIQDFLYPEHPKDVTKILDRTIVNTPKAWGTLNGHDPSIYKDGNTYYVFSTDVAVGRNPTQGIQIRKSTDLITWKYVGTALDSIPSDVADYSGATNLWAPDIIKLGNLYYLYYSGSTSGSQRSCIAYAVAENIEGPWINKGIILKSDYTTEANDIDPCVFFDNGGNYWMVYGSFFGGIFLLKMDPKTGVPAEKGEGSLIATRGDQAGEEAPYIVYNSQFKKYYLFTSYDSLMSDYNIRVGRADKVTGPYYDISGQKMTDYPYSDDVPDDVEIISQNVGYKLMGGYYWSEGTGWLAPGHNSVLNDSGKWFLVHHARTSKDINWPYLQIRLLVWSDDGWPMASPECYAGESEKDIPLDHITGQWEILCHNRLDYMDPHAEKAIIEPDGIFKTVKGNGNWSFDGKETITMSFVDEDGNKTTITAKTLASWDWERNRGTTTFTGKDQNGQVWWGKRIRAVKQN